MGRSRAAATVTFVPGPGGRRAGRAAALLAVAALVTAACAGDDDGSDGSGIEVGVDPAGDATTDPGCDWPMWGREPGRTFAQTCDSELSTATVDRLELDWSFTTEDVVTASAAVHEGTVYAGDLENLRSAIRAHRLVGKHFGLTGRPAYRQGLAGMYRALGRHWSGEGHPLRALAVRGYALWLER